MEAKAECFSRAEAQVLLYEGVSRFVLAPELIKISGLGVDTPPIFAFSSVHLAQHSWNAASTLHLERDQYAIPRVTCTTWRGVCAKKNRGLWEVTEEAKWSWSVMPSADVNNSDTPIMQLERRDSDVLELIWCRCRDISVRRS